MSFFVDIERFAKKAKATLGETSRAIKISLFNGVIMDTRVDTGRLRGNWTTTTGAPASTSTDRLDPTGSVATAEVISTVTEIGVDYLVNNLPYAEVWEERDGMIARNMARIQRTVREAARG